MSGKRMEGDDRHRRRKAHDARKRGKRPSEEGGTFGASKQAKHVAQDEGHVEKVETIREGKQPVISENTPEPSPRSRRPR